MKEQKISENLVPEIHDIGKLINKESTGIEHNFENYPGIFKKEEVPKIKENAIWKGIREHHCQLPHEEKKKVLNKYPISRKTIILALADNLASAVSRHVKESSKHLYYYNVYKLWNPTTNITELSYAIGAHSMGKEWISKIVNFVNKKPGKEEYFKEFGEYLKKRCEDATPGCNITSLWTHSILTGKFYKILENIEIPTIDFNKKDKVCKLVNQELPEKTKLVVMKCKIKFPHYIYRTRDLNILKIRENILKKFQKNPEVLFVTSDEVIIFSIDGKILENLKKEIEKYSFYIEIKKAVFILRERKELPKEIKKAVDGVDPRELSSDPEIVKDRIKKLYRLFESKIKKKLEDIPPEKRKEIEERMVISFRKSDLYKEIEWLKSSYSEERIYPKLEDEIFSDMGICEICQLNPIKPYEELSEDERRLVEDEESKIIDKLCEKCIEIRKYGEPLRLLGEWKEGNVIWIKLTLNFEKLVEVLRQLYVDYLKSLEIQNPEEKAEIRPSVIGEFLQDYKEFLEEFSKEIHKIFDSKEKRVQDILEDMFCIKIEKLSEILNVLKIYMRVINKFFPKFNESEESPIKLVISYSNVKFPFFEHWKYLEEPKKDIDVILIGKYKGYSSINLKQLDSVIKLSRILEDKLKGMKIKASLYRLIEISEYSEELAQRLIIGDEEFVKHFPELQQILARELSLKDILTYVKILEEEYE
ncbi:hypothetical protein DRN69_00515 [Candidatus Pacearchaeota archaeon]|nr:MAG: hypothetical protein DRN69_00515 [Candidatus Pacearchaeota archaeon]